MVSKNLSDLTVAQNLAAGTITHVAAGANTKGVYISYYVGSVNAAGSSATLSVNGANAVSYIWSTGQLEDIYVPAGQAVATINIGAAAYSSIAYKIL